MSLYSGSPVTTSDVVPAPRKTPGRGKLEDGVFARWARVQTHPYGCERGALLPPFSKREGAHLR